VPKGSNLKVLLKAESFRRVALTKNFLLPLQIKMVMIILKLTKALRIIGAGLFISMIAMSSMQVGYSKSKMKNLITCDADLSDTINLGQERSRGRVFFDILKKVTFLGNLVQKLYVRHHQISDYAAKSLFLGVVQRNVFYVYACSTVP
jgi:hypothetical protein